MAHLGGVCDLVQAQKDELSQSKHMGLTIYTKENINLASCGQDHADVLMWVLKGETCLRA